MVRVAKILSEDRDEYDLGKYSKSIIRYDPIRFETKKLSEFTFTDPESAAKVFFEEVWSEWEYPDSGTLIVVMDDGTEYLVTVQVQMQPHFTATATPVTAPAPVQAAPVQG